MAMEDIRWKGPRPLASGDLLEGRSDDLSLLVSKARNHDVITITAPSGVGKSSFVAAGLVARLREAGGRVVPEPFAWSEVLAMFDEDEPTTNQAEALYRRCVGIDSNTSLGDFFDSLEETHDGRGRRTPVVVLDQVEELIRFREGLGEAFLRFVGRTAYGFGVTHVVAARSEYLDQLRPVGEHPVSAFGWPLPEINEPSVVASIIAGPVEAAGIEIEEHATDLLTSWWSSARSRPQIVWGGSSSPIRTQVGLLHLQGLLWLFRNWLIEHANDESEITETLVRRFASDHLDLGGRPDAEAIDGALLLPAAMIEYVRYQCDSFGEGLRWTNGPRLMLARSAYQLSVMGYKIATSYSHLLRSVLAEEVEPTTARAVASDRGTVEEIAERNSAGVRTAGIARHWTPAEVLAELQRALQHALIGASSEDANLLRRFRQQDDEVYELVHDGMGPALQAWAEQALEEPRANFGLITPRIGHSVVVDLVPGTFLRDDGGVPDHWGEVVSTEGEKGKRRVVLKDFVWDANAMMSRRMEDMIFEGCDYVGALFRPLGAAEDGGITIRNVVFRRCNLKGAAFHDATLEDVVFEDCDLRGAAIRGCKLSGVWFRSSRTSSTSSASAIDTLSFESTTADGDGAHISAPSYTSGLFFSRVAGGPWAIRGSEIAHVSFDAEDPATIRLEGGPYSHVSLGGPVSDATAGDVPVTSLTTTPSGQAADAVADRPER